MPRRTSDRATPFSVSLRETELTDLNQLAEEKGVDRSEVIRAALVHLGVIADRETITF